MAWLTLARSLIARVSLARWRGWLGHRIDAGGLPNPTSQSMPLPENLAARRLARAVGRAAARLPGESRCLAQAVALHCMMRRRGLRGTLIIGVRREAERGGVDDLHAWLVQEGETLIGAGRAEYVPIVGFSPEPQNDEGGPVSP